MLLYYSDVLLCSWQMKPGFTFSCELPWRLAWLGKYLSFSFGVMKNTESQFWFQVWSQQILLAHSCEWSIQLTMVKFDYYSLTLCTRLCVQMFKRKQSFWRVYTVLYLDSKKWKANLNMSGPAKESPLSLISKAFSNSLQLPMDSLILSSPPPQRRQRARSFPVPSGRIATGGWQAKLALSVKKQRKLLKLLCHFHVFVVQSSLKSVNTGTLWCSKHWRTVATSAQPLFLQQVWGGDICLA